MTYPELEEALADALIAAIPNAGPGRAAAPGEGPGAGGLAAPPPAAGPGPEAALRAVLASQALEALIDALPYYADPAYVSQFRAGLANLAEINLPNDKIAPQPSESGFGYYNSYSYNGPYSGYRHAFFTNVGGSAAAAAIGPGLQAANPGITAAWWGGYGLALLTDAARARAGFDVDSGRLAGAMGDADRALRGSMWAASLGMIRGGWAPTTNAWAQLQAAGGLEEARAELAAGICSAGFIANINEALSMGGDSTNAAAWFLYHNWILVALLGGDPDAVIAAAQAAGMDVPEELAPGTWRSGYTAWYAALNGEDVAAQAGGRLVEGMPERSTLIVSGSYFPIDSNVTADKGYSLSLGVWGPLNRYYQPPSSCFADGAGVLMADLSVKAIETVVEGDAVWTPQGPRRVALVERPLSRRALARIAGLALGATEGHPLRRPEDGGPRYAALNAWSLHDGVPTMAESGVVELSPGVTLAAVDRQGRPQPFQVEEMSVEPARPEGEEVRVHDLLLENWERDRPAYYVGGPDLFVAAEAESSDPLREPKASLTLLSALAHAVPASRASLAAPHLQAPALVRRLPAADAFDAARRAAWSAAGGVRAAAPSIPGPEFYMTDGAWEPHATLLEAQLLRRFARTWRRFLATGWRDETPGRAPGDRLTVLVHDLELAGDAPVEAGAPAVLRLAVQDHGLHPETGLARELRAEPRADRRWHPRFDALLDFGPFAPSPDAALEIAWMVAGRPAARLRLPVGGAQAGAPSREHFLVSPEGAPLGRIALDLGWRGAPARRAEARRRAEWTPARARAAALALGDALGRSLAEAAGETRARGRPPADP